MQIQIRTQSPAAGREVAEYARQRLRFWLGRFNGSVRLATVRLNAAGECRITIETAWHSRVVISARHTDLPAAVARAAERAGRAIERQMSLRNN